MSAIAHIRKNVFHMTQAAFAEVAGSNQGTVCRWEKGELEPDRDKLELIRAAALQRDLPWDDRWFFEPAPAVDDAVPERERAAS